MSLLFPKLFERGKIGQLDLDNRIIKAPTILFMANTDGSVNDRIMRYYEQVARGGAGLVIVEAAGVEQKPTSGLLPCQLVVASMKHLPGLSSLAQAIRDNGARAALQIVHHGADRAAPGTDEGSDDSWEKRFLVRGAMASPADLTLEEVKGIIRAFGDAAWLAQSAGFDMVEIHGGHGVLITSFLSPSRNKRTDSYGGSLENRSRFLVEIVREIKTRTGADFPLGVRLSGTDYEPNGITIEETLVVAQAMAEAGVNVIHVSGGSHHQGIHLASPMSIPRGHNVWAAEAVKKVVQIPVIASGSITTPDFAEEILTSGKADFISLARPLFADPEWPKKAREGRPEDIRPCLRCNDGCQHRSNLNFRAILCTVNVALGKEDTLPITKAAKPRKVAIIGGGPGGMEAARVCALRGHEVTLYEKRQLGGALIEASVPEFKADLRPLIAYYQTQLEKLKVKVNMAEANVDAIKNGKFDTVVVAIGAQPARPAIPGIDKPNVANILDVFAGKARLGEKVYIAGGGVIAVEAGLFLAEQGKEIIFSTRQEELMTDAGSFDKSSYTEMLARHKVTAFTNNHLDTILDDGVEIIDKEGQRQKVTADSIILAAGFVPLTDLEEALEKEADLEVYAIGDCVKPGRIYDAIHDGNLAGRKI